MRFKPMPLALAALAATAVSVRAAGPTVDQSGQQFSEKSLTLKVSDTVTFINQDNVTHNVSIVDEDDDTTDLGLQKPGNTLVYKFDKAGRFKVRCSVHPGMKMSVTVK